MNTEKRKRTKTIITIALVSALILCLTAAPAVADYTLDDVTNADIPVSGTVTGSYIDTHTFNEVHEAITEVESGGGPPSSRISYLEHKWTINVTGGNKVTFYVEAYRTANSENDNFVFAYSANDSIYTDMVTVTKPADDGIYQTCEMLETLNGTVYIRVKDTNRGGGNTVLDTIYVDHMYVRSVLDTTPPAITNATGDTLSTTGEAKTISATITDDGDVIGAAVHYTPIDGTETAVQMTEGAGDVWSADVPVASDKAGTITYYITAEDEIPNIARDPATGTHSITVTDNDAPSTISDLTATAVAGGGIELAWSAATDNVGVVSYNVYRNLSVITDATGLTPIANITGTTYTDWSGEEGTTYYYAVTAVDAVGNEADVSNSPSAAPDATPPSSITILSPTNTTYHTTIINLIVSADEPVDQYQWWYNLNSGGNTTFTPNTTIIAQLGSNHLIVYASDTAENENSSKEVYFSTSNYINTCSVLNSEDTTYYLTSDIINSDATACIVITADNVTLDCQGHTIDGNLSLNLNKNSEDNKYAIYSNNSHTTIKNGKISNWQNGIYLDSGADNGYIENNFITEVFGASSGGNAAGIFLKSGGNVVYNNSISTLTGRQDGGTATGIYLEKSTSNTLTSISISNLTGEQGGATCFWCSGISGGTVTGIYLKNSTSNSLTSTTISNLTAGHGGYAARRGAGAGGTATGIYLENSNSNSLSLTTISNLIGGHGGSGGTCWGGAGGTAAGIYLKSSNSNSLSLTSISNLTAGHGGTGQYWPPAISGMAMGIGLDTNSYDNIITELTTQGSYKIPEENKLNKINGKPILYFYNETGLNVSGYNITTNTVPILISGEEGITIASGITLINTTDSIIETNTVSGFKGMEGRINGIQGGTATGVYLKNSISNNLISNTIANLIGGQGAPVPGPHNSGGTGGTAAGVYLDSSTSNSLTSTSISNLTGGEGGDPGRGSFLYVSRGAGGIATGIYINSSTLNNLISNTISSLTGGQGAGVGTAAGIYLYSAANNVIYNNLFNSPDSYYFAGTIYPNRWNTTKHSETNVIGKPYIGGNYWGKPDGTGYSDTCWDITGDYICEEPYTLAANNTDYLPLTHNSDTIPPFISINSPLPDAISSETIDINLTATDAYLDYTNISVIQNGNLINSTTSETNGTHTVTLSVQNAGVYNITATAYDLAGNSNSSFVQNLTVNLSPKPKITSPAEGSSISGVVTVEALDESGEGDIVYNLFECYEDTDCNCKADDGNAWIEIGNDTDGSDGWSADWDTIAIDDGCYIIRATMGDVYGFIGSDEINVEVGKLLPVWQHAAVIPWDAERLSSGNTLIAEHGGHRVLEVNPAGEMVWHYGNGTAGLAPGQLNSPLDAERLSDNNTLITDCINERVIEVNSTGAIVWQYGNGTAGSGVNQLNHARDAERLENGNTLIADRLNNRVIEVRTSDYDPTQPNNNFTADSIVWQMTGLNHPVDAERLSNNNTLIVEYKNHSVIEINTTTRELIWQYGTGTPGSGVNELNYPTDAERLSNGNTLIVDSMNDRVIEVRTSDYDPAKGYNGFTADSIVWEYESNYPTDAERLSNSNNYNYTLISEAGNNRVIEVFTPPPKPKELKPLTPILISGFVNDDFGPVNNPTVIITNLNTSEVFNATTIATSSYYQVLTSSEHVCCVGNALHFNVSDNSGNRNITIHVVTEDDLNAGGLEQNITVLVPYTDMVVTAINVYHNDTDCPAWFNLSNEIDVTVKNLGTASAGASNVSLCIDGEFSGKLSVPGLNSEESATVTFTNWVPIGEDCLQPPCDFELLAKYYNFTGVADCDNDVEESEENNEITVVDRACYNGYMADEPLENVAHGLLKGRLNFTTGDGKYASLYSVGDTQVTNYDITLPEGAAVELAHLNVYYTWCKPQGTCPEMEVSITTPGGTTHTLTLMKAYNDIKCTCPGASWILTWGNYVYNMTDYITENGTYTVTVKNVCTECHYFCPAAPGIVLVYEDENAPPIEYWINEGADILMGGRRYPTSSNLAWWENINNATFQASSNTSTVRSATLGVVAPWGGSTWEPGMTNYLFFNDLKLGTGVYQGYSIPYEETIDSITMHVGGYDAQVGVNVTDVTALYLNASDNVVGQADDGDNMMPANAFLVVEYGEKVPPMPDLTVTEKNETLLEDGNFSVTYTVANIGDGDAGASTTTITTSDGQSVMDSSVPALASGASYTNTVGPFNCPCNQTLNVTVCADSDGVVDESDEGNNCLSNELVCPVCKFIPAGVTFDKKRLDLNSNGTLKAFITLPEGYNATVADINVSTVECEGAEAFGDGVIPGKQALEVKFKIPDLRKDLPTGDNVTMTVTGKLYDGRPFEGSNTLKVVYSGKTPK